MFEMLLQNSNRWWFYWAVLTPVISLAGFYIASETTSFVFLLGELLPSALFGLYLANAQKFKINLLKALMVFTALFVMVVVLKKMAMVIAPVAILLLMWLLKIKKEEAKWMFGSIVLYSLCAIPSLLLLINFQNSLAMLVVGYMVKGVLFGVIMGVFYRRYLTRLQARKRFKDEEN